MIRQAGRYPELEPDSLEHASTDSEASRNLSPLDAAFAHAVYDGAVRRWLTLEYLLNLRLKQPLAELEPRLRATLLCGAAQILLLDKVPVHAAINHSVEWAKSVIRPGAGAMVNAVLRRVAEMIGSDGERAAALRETATGRRDELPLESGGALALWSEILPEHEEARLSVAYSLPQPLLSHWSRSRSPAEARRLAQHGIAAAPIIFNTRNALAPLPDDVFTPHESPSHHVFRGTTSQLVPLLGSRSDIWVQDPGSSHPVANSAHLRPRLIADLCAGRGTKTRQLAAVFPQARIIATDVDQSRREVLARVFERSEQVRVLAPKAAQATLLEEGGADLVVLDVPCTNTGVLARRPEARYRFGERHLDSLVNTQRQIMADSIPLLRNAGSGKGPERGAILYATCSLEEEENGAQARWAAKWHRFRIEREESTPPNGLPGEPPTAYRDGSYSALLT